MGRVNSAAFRGLRTLAGIAPCGATTTCSASRSYRGRTFSGCSTPPSAGSTWTARPRRTPASLQGPYRGQPLLRIVNARTPNLVRGGGQTSRGRRRERESADVERDQGRDPPRYRSQPRGPSHRRHRAAPCGFRSGRFHREARARLHRKRRRWGARAPDPSLARCVHHPSTQKAPRPTRCCDLRRHSPFEGGAVERAPARCLRQRSKAVWSSNAHAALPRGSWTHGPSPGANR